MTLCLIVEADASPAEFEQIFAHVRSTGPVPPDGARLIMGGPADSGRRMISVWDSQQARDRFLAERLAPAYAAAGLSIDQVRKTSFDLDTLVAGDLTGVPQS